MQLSDTQICINNYRYQSGHQLEADESTGLVFLSKEDIKSWNIPDSLVDQLTQHGLGGLRLYHLYLNL